MDTKSIILNGWLDQLGKCRVSLWLRWLCCGATWLNG